MASGGPRGLRLEGEVPPGLLHPELGVEAPLVELGQRGQAELQLVAEVEVEVAVRPHLT